jgi:hypothetical protein
MTKKKKLFVLFEIILLFSVFFLPGYLSQGMEVDPGMFNSPRFNIVYILTALPQIFLLLYIIYLREGAPSSSRELFANYGLVRPDISLLWKVPVVFLGVLALAFSASFIEYLPVQPNIEGFEPVPWRIDNPSVLPLVFITSLVTGYREELFFRSYLINRIGSIGVKQIPVILLAALVFSVGHLYQGAAALLGTFSIGCFLGVLYVRFRNIHMLALGHAFYNFFSLILLPSFSSFLI